MASFDDSDDEETYIKLGNPLPELGEDEGRKKPVSMQDIQARDSKGRPRFHGAFTGGFSAGYFNTVGSKEGWTPSTFVSSRTKKAESEFVQRPETFMDEEDFSEHGIAPRKLVTAGQFTSEERKRRRLDEAKAGTQDAAVPGVPALVDLIVPERISIGVKLLRKMGWKEGQGVGPRLSKRQRKLQKSGKKIYGCALPPSSSEEEDDLDDSAVLKDITFAPRDITPIHLLAKDNTHGLGYRGLNPQSALPSTHINLFEPPAITKTGRKGIRGQAFGVGALEDDDDDIYSTDHISNYDVTMGDEEDNNFGWTAPGRRGQTETPVGYVGKMLAGFKLSSTPLVQKKHFPPPSLPRNFRPVHVFKKPDEEEHQSASVPLSTARGVPQFMKPGEEENQSTAGPPGSFKGKPQFNDAMSRGIALGEQPFVGTVFDLISKEDKKKMEEAKLTSKTSNIEQTQPTTQSDIVKQSLDQSRVSIASDLTSKEPVQTIQSQEPVRSHSSQEPVLTSLEEQRRSGVPLFQGGAGFKPFTRDPDKQERYEKYLTLVKQGHKDPYSAVIMPGQTEWETEREREEFARAAKLYKPLAGMMAMRFTTGKQQDDVGQVDVKVEETIDKCDATKAAEMKMYGKLTRDVLEWHPDRLLCKRFNIPDPYPGSSIVGLATVKRDKFSVFNFLSFPSQPETSQTELPALPESSGRSLSATETVSREDSEKTESKVDKELNKSKNMKSIFSHLVETEKQTQKITKGLSFSVKSVNPNKPKEFKSIFSHLEDTDYKPKPKLVPMETDEPQSGSSDKEASKSTSKQEEQVKARITTSKTDQQVQHTAEEAPEMDLFRAIFKNTDSEDSSSSDEDVDDEKSTANDKTTANDEKEKDSIITERTDDSTHGEDRLKENLDGDFVSQQPHPPDSLPGNGEAIPSLGQRLSPQLEELDDEYGPALPPSLPAAKNTEKYNDPPIPAKAPPADRYVDLTKTSSSSKKHKHHKHKTKKDKKEKHKKSKHKKKEKKKEKKKKERREKSSSDTDNTSDKDTESEDSSSEVPSDRDIRHKMKSLRPGQRLRAIDFM